MRTLVFDIETIGETWSEFDDVTKQTLTSWVENTSKSDSEKQKILGDIQSGLGLSPLTGKIVSLALYDVERHKGAVYYLSDTHRDEVVQNWSYKVRDEADLLRDWWDGVKEYDTFVTFNGRSFDVPFLVHRSLIHSILPTKNLMAGRYPSQQKRSQHIDLQDAMTFYGAMYRRPSLHLVCRAYGIKSPKTEISGDHVAALFHEKKCRDIAEYNIRDVIATAALYERWRQYINIDNDIPEDGNVH